MENSKKNRQPVINVLTGSNIDCKERASLLLYAAESLCKAFSGVQIIHHISYSLSEGLPSETGLSLEMDLAELQKAGDYEAIVVRRDRKLSLIRHLCLLVFEERFGQNAVVMFCRDEDLLIRAPEGLEKLFSGQMNGIRGYHCVPVVENGDGTQEKMADPMLETGGPEDVKAAMQRCERASEWIKDMDLTGYMCRFWWVSGFFQRTAESLLSEGPASTEALAKARESLMDVELMKAIDGHIPHMPARPFVFRRVWSSPDRSEWKSDVVSALQKVEAEKGLAKAQLRALSQAVVEQLEEIRASETAANAELENLTAYQAVATPERFADALRAYHRTLDENGRKLEDLRPKIIELKRLREAERAKLAPTGIGE